MTKLISISATDLSMLGKCKAMIKPRPGVAQRDTSVKAYWGDRHHSDFEINVDRFMKGRSR